MLWGTLYSTVSKFLCVYFRISFTRSFLLVLFPSGLCRCLFFLASLLYAWSYTWGFPWQGISGPCLVLLSTYQKHVLLHNLCCALFPAQFHRLPTAFSFSRLFPPGALFLLDLPGQLFSFPTSSSSPGDMQVVCHRDPATVKKPKKGKFKRAGMERVQINIKKGGGQDKRARRKATNRGWGQRLYHVG